MKKEAEIAKKRRAIEIPPPEYDPTIRKKHRSQHALVTITKNKFITKSEKARLAQETAHKEEPMMETSVLSIKSDKTDTSTNSSTSTTKTSNTSIHKPPSTTKEDESFTDILKEDLDLSLEDGEIPEKTMTKTKPRTSTPIKEIKSPERNIDTEPRKEPQGQLYIPEPNHDFPSYDPSVSRCQKYVPTSEILFDLYSMVRKANQNVGLAMRKAMIAEKLLISKNPQQ